jgi:5-methylcytosine-specific restriction endonuclease McrA
MIDSLRCEVLNVTYEPLRPVPVRRAINLVIKGKATIIEEHSTLHIVTGNDIFPIPVQIRMNYLVKGNGRNMRSPAALTQTNMFLRDKFTCQYCDRHKSQLLRGEILTRDHVHPQSKGGKDVWTNVVTACNVCNNKKANNFLSETNLTLRKPPHVPTTYEVISKSQYRKRISND